MTSRRQADNELDINAGSPGGLEPGEDGGGEAPQPVWARLWTDFITSGHCTTPEHPDYLRLSVLNLVGGAGFLVWTLFLALNLLDVFEFSPLRVFIDIMGMAVTAGALVALRVGAPVTITAEVVHVFLFVLLLGAAVAKADNPLAMTIPMIYPAVAFLLLDNVTRASLWTLMMIVVLNFTLFMGFGPHLASRDMLANGAMSVTTAMFFQAAVMALYVHNRKQVMTRLRTLGAELSFMAMRDDLTGLYNRRTFRDTVNRELARRDSEARLFGFLLFDIDRFKVYNDTFGHPQGDRLIRRIAAAAQSIFSRREDLVFRLGGEEFGVVYRASSEANGTAMANRLLTAVEKLNEPAPAGPQKALTVSAGLVLTEGEADLSADEVFRYADEALYRAKQLGRARWVRADVGRVRSRRERRPELSSRYAEQGPEIPEAEPAD